MPAIARSGQVTIRFLAVALLGVLVIQPASGQPPAAKSFDAAHPEKMARGLELFQKQVQAILTSSCLRCHGGKSTESGLDLSDRDKLLKGGDSGAAILPGKGKDSLLFKLAAHEMEPHMPHKGKKLSSEALRLLERLDRPGRPL